MDGEGKDKKEIRRPMNAFLIFCKRHRSVVRQKHPDMDNRSITRMLGDLWANLGEEKNTYTNLAKQYKDAFLKANPNYKWHNSDKLVNSTSKATTKTVNPWMMKSVGDMSQEGCIIPGKLADLDKMGGLNLLLMADKETSHDAPVSSSSLSSAPSHVVSTFTEQPARSQAITSTANSALLQLAEMCSSELNKPTIRNSSLVVPCGKAGWSASNSASLITHSTPKTSNSVTNSSYHQPMPPPKKRARHWSLTELDSVSDSQTVKTERDDDDSLDLSPLNLSAHHKRIVSLPQLEKYSDVEHFKRSTPKRRLSSSATESIPSPLPSYMEGAESPVFHDSFNSDKQESSLSDVKTLDQSSRECEKLPNFEQRFSPGFVSGGPGAVHPSNTGRYNATGELPQTTSIKLEHFDLPKVSSVKLNTPELSHWRDLMMKSNQASPKTTVEPLTCVKLEDGSNSQCSVKFEPTNWLSEEKSVKLFIPSTSPCNVQTNGPENATFALAQIYERMKSQSLAEKSVPTSQREICEPISRAPPLNSSSTEVKLKKKWVERMLVETKLYEDVQRHEKMPLMHSHQAEEKRCEFKTEAELNGHSNKITAGSSQKDAQKHLNPVQPSTEAISQPCQMPVSQPCQMPVSFSAISHPKLMMQLSQNQAPHSYQPGQIWRQKCWSGSPTKELPQKLFECAKDTKEKAPNSAWSSESSAKEGKSLKEPILKPIAACGQKIYDHILQKLNSSNFNVERPVMKTRFPLPAMTLVGTKSEQLLNKSPKDEQMWVWRDTTRKPMTASSLVEKVVREVCGSPPRKDGCSSCCTSELLPPQISLVDKNSLSPSPLVMTINQEMTGKDITAENKSDWRAGKTSDSSPSHEADSSSKCVMPAIDSGDLSEHEDSIVPQVRKSRRANRGQKYQELIKEGFIQPSRERLAARNAERSGRTFGTKEEFEKLDSKKVLKRSASEKDSLSDSANTKLVSSPSDSALFNEDEKRFKSGAFDLEKEIESLPVCSIEQMEKKKASRRRSDLEPQMSGNKIPVETDSGIPGKTSETVGTVNFQGTGCPAPHIPIPKEKRPSEPVTGSRKRKARSYCITRLSVEAQGEKHKCDVSTRDQPNEEEKTSPSSSRITMQAEVTSNDNEASLNLPVQVDQKLLDTDMATSALLKLSATKCESKHSSAPSAANSNLSFAMTSNENKKQAFSASRLPISTSSSKNVNPSAASYNKPSKKSKTQVKCRKVNSVHTSSDLQMCSLDFRASQNISNAAGPLNVHNSPLHVSKKKCSVQFVNRGDTNVVASSLKVSPLSDLKGGSPTARMLSARHNVSEAKLKEEANESRGHLNVIGQLSHGDNIKDRSSNSPFVEERGEGATSAVVSQMGSSCTTDDSLSHRICLESPCTPGTTATVVIALPSYVMGSQLTVHPHLRESEQCVLAGADTYMLVSSSNCYTLAAPANAISTTPSSSLFNVAPSVISLPNSPSTAMNEIVSYSVIGSGSVMEAGSPHMIGSPHLPESPSVAAVQS
ncbi:uncharacterized protein LOC106070710 isoform X1 [Biomphalaria glabrata]|uniref:Uncharacterized protein LOC106070710 isoform X1 n=1 Tax=Biomphalaria glabrata TaxID=6526 RepID=A0A9W2YUU9_BIOGL|nr:uncharacterized protein LOC106070710 isoform X1 [Biomphalaria glabrata]XP_055866410.1 uncharacterized protein LOC106070710 isoform X1 [Biomphalaria glabrata]